MKKIRIIALILCIVMIFAVALGCSKEEEADAGDKEGTGSSFDDVEKNDEDNDEKDTSSDDTNMTGDREIDEVVKGFMDALFEDDADSAVEYLGFGDDTFIDLESAAWYLPRTDFRDLLGSNGEIKSATTQDTGMDKTVTVNIDIDGRTSSIDLRCELDNNNDYKIISPQMYAKDWMIKVANKAKVFIGDIEVGNEYFDKTDDGSDIYIIPAIIMDQVDVKVVTTEFGEYTESLIPVSNEQDQIRFILDSTKGQEFLEEFQKMYNKLLESNNKDKPVDDVLDLFSDSFDMGAISTLYNSSITELNSDAKWVEMRTIIPRPETDIFVMSDNTIALNFGYSIAFHQTKGFKGEESTSRWSSIILQKDGDALRIHTITDNKLFTYKNQYTHDF